MKLLIVDDHAGVRAMIREIAKVADTDVRECGSGEAAILAVRDFAPDLVTMDARMPGMSGIDATRAIRALRPTAHVVVVSSYNLSALRTAALQAGATDFVPKDNLEQLRPLFARFRASAADAPADEPWSAQNASED
jgi:CheY-like chemotaxis protein